MFMSFIREETGATAIEYGLIAGLIAVAIIAAAGYIGGSLDTLFSSVGDQLTDATAP